MRKYLNAVVWGLVLGTLARKYGYPYVVAKIESMDLDSVWDVWDTEEWM